MLIMHMHGAKLQGLLVPSFRASLSLQKEIKPGQQIISIMCCQHSICVRVTHFRLHELSSHLKKPCFACMGQQPAFPKRTSQASASPNILLTARQSRL